MTAHDPLKFTSFVTEQAEDKWQSIIVTPIENYTDYPYKGRLFGVLSLLNDSKKVDCISIGEILKDYLIDSFYEIDEPNIIDLLEETIHKTKTQLSDMIRSSSVIGNEVVDMECVLVSVRDNVFYGASFGESDVVLFNKNKKIDLGEFFKDTSGRNDVKVMSGVLKDEDKLLISVTGSLSRVIETKLLTHIHEFDLINLIPNSRVNVHSCVLLTGYNLSGVVNSTHTIKHEVKEEIVKYEEAEKEHIKDELEESHIEEQKVLKGELEYQVNEPKVPEDEWTEEEKTAEVLVEDKFDRSTIEERPELNTNTKEVPIQNNLKSSFGSKIKGIFSKENQTTVIVLIRKLLSFVKRVLIKIKDGISSLILSRRKVGQIYVRKGKQTNRIIPIAIAIVVIVVVLVLGARQISLNNEEKAKTEKATQIVSEATQLSTQARDNATVNRVRSGELLAESILKITEAETYGKFTDEINAIKVKNKETQNIIDKVIAITDTNIFLDLGLKFPGSKPNSIQLTKDKVLVSEVDKKAYVSSKSTPDFNKIDITDTRLTGIDAITTDIDGNLVMFDKDNGLFTYSMVNSKVEKLAGLSDVVTGPVKAMSTYKGGGTEYLYTLRNDNSSIYKMTKVSTGYTQPEVRLTDDAFASGTDLDIDGKIWITTANKIYRFVGNTEEKYVLDSAGAPKLPTTYTKIAVSSTYVFVADNTNKKVLIFTKGASNNATKIDYVASIAYEGVYGTFGDIIDLKVEGDKLYILDSNRVYLFQVIIPENYK